MIFQAPWRFNHIIILVFFKTDTFNIPAKLDSQFIFYSIFSRGLQSGGDGLLNWLIFLSGEWIFHVCEHKYLVRDPLLKISWVGQKCVVRFDQFGLFDGGRLSVSFYGSKVFLWLRMRPLSHQSAVESVPYFGIALLSFHVSLSGRVFKSCKHLTNSRNHLSGRFDSFCLLTFFNLWFFPVDLCSVKVHKPTQKLLWIALNTACCPEWANAAPIAPTALTCLTYLTGHDHRGLLPTVSYGEH